MYLCNHNTERNSTNARNFVAFFGAASGAAATTNTAGFYGSIYADITKTKFSSSTELSQSVASNIISGNTISLTSGNSDIAITGSNITSINGDINLNAMLGNINIKAGESTQSQEAKYSSRSLGGSVGNNGANLNAGFSQSESSFDQTTYTNATLTANNGTLKLNSKEDTNIIGANLLAENITINTQGNLTVKSKQDLTESSSNSIGASIGGGTGPSGPTGNVGFNIGSSEASRAWVDNITSIIGTNSVTINTGNNTSIIGAEIANISKDANNNSIDLGNLTLNTKTLTYSNLENYSNSDSSSFAAALQIGKSANNPTLPGRLKLDLALNGQESSSITNATIGRGNITTGVTITFLDKDGTTSSGDVIASTGGTLNDATSLALTGLNRDINNTESNKRNVITSDFDATLTIDTRLLAALGSLLVGDTAGAEVNFNSYKNEVKDGVEAYSHLASTTINLGSDIANAATTTAASNELTIANFPQLTIENISLRNQVENNPQLLNQYSENANYYSTLPSGEKNSVGNLKGFYDEERGVFVNTAVNVDAPSLTETLFHENYHATSTQNNETEEAFATHYGNRAADLYDHYYSSVSGINKESFNLDSWYNNTTNNITSSEIALNNFTANHLVNPATIEPYQKDVHKYLTLYLAENSGFTHEDARQIAAGNYRVDTDWNTQPLTLDTTMQLLLFQGRPKEDFHFTTPERRENMRQVAYETGNLELFGQYLHAFQDSFSHQKDGVGYDSGIGHLNIFQDEMGAHVDRTYNRPELADQMARATYVEMQKFLEHRGVTPPNSMNYIYPKIQFFNRAFIEDNNAKGNILFK